jgi:hypothetical protein
VSEAEYELACGNHSKRPTAFVCTHLLRGANKGFHWGVDDQDPDNPCPDAWCNACDKAVQQEGSWNDRAVAAANIKKVCDRCYEKFRQRHWGDDSRELKRAVRAGAVILNTCQQRLEERFKLSTYEPPDWSQSSGQLVFLHRGQPRLIADVVLVGNLSTRDNTWLWSWANKYDEESIKKRIREVRRYGEKHHILKIACAHWDATETNGWEMVGAAAMLLGGVGAYRVPSADGYSYLLLSSINWAQ